jgi:hypothetical protein
VRPDRQAGSYLIQKLLRARSDLNDMKALQTFGSSNFAVLWLHKSLTVAEITISIPANSAACMELTLTPNSSIANPSVALAFEVRTVGPGAGLPIATALPSIGGVQKWHVWHPNSTAAAINRSFRFTFLTISDATWAVTQIV